LVRVPDQLAALFDAEAERQGVHRNDFILEALAEKLGVPYDPQERLPISAA